MVWILLLVGIVAVLALSLLRRAPDRKGGRITHAYKSAAAVVAGETQELQSQLRHASDAALAAMMDEGERTCQLLEQTKHASAGRWEHEKDVEVIVALQVARARLELMKQERAARRGRPNQCRKSIA
jgi:hypothetical protein